jgi:thiamine-monophosphate kinase
MTLNLSEKKLLERICRIAQFRRKELKVGIGEDCAVMRRTPGKDLLLSADLLVEGVHFRLDWTSPFLLGYKALTVNVSDIAAMGGRPILYLVSLALPAHLSKPAFVDNLYRGMEEAARASKVALAGGDLSSSVSGVVISIAIAGLAPADRAILRSGARPGDYLFICGHLGLSAIGLELLRSGYRVPAERAQNRTINGLGGMPKTVSQWRDHCIMAHLAPKPMIHLGMELSAGKMASAMMDVSDGLSIDLHRLCEAGRVGAVLQHATLPCCPIEILSR